MPIAVQELETTARVLAGYLRDNPSAAYSDIQKYWDDAAGMICNSWTLDYVIGHWEASGLVSTVTLDRPSSDNTIKDYAITVYAADATQLAVSYPRAAIWPGESDAPMPHGFAYLDD